MAGASGGGFGGGATHALNKIPPTMATINNAIRVLFISDVPFLFSKSSNFGLNQKGHQSPLYYLAVLVPLFIPTTPKPLL